MLITGNGRNVLLYKSIHEYMYPEASEALKHTLANWYLYWHQTICAMQACDRPATEWAMLLARAVCTRSTERIYKCLAMIDGCSMSCVCAYEHLAPERPAHKTHNISTDIIDVDGSINTKYNRANAFKHTPTGTFDCVLISSAAQQQHSQAASANEANCQTAKRNNSFDWTKLESERRAKDWCSFS